MRCFKQKSGQDALSYNVILRSYDYNYFTICHLNASHGSLRVRVWFPLTEHVLASTTTSISTYQATTMTETSRPSTWQSVAKQKQVERLRRIPAKWRLKSIPSTANVEHVPRTCGILSASELDITENYDATALAEAIAKRRLTCIDVTRAFCKVSLSFYSYRL